MRNEELGIVLATFGSADDSIRENIFDKLTAEISAAFSTFAVLAFPSNFMLRKLARRNIFMPTPAEAISRLRGEGFTKIFLLPTLLTPGEEFDNKIKPCSADDVEIIPPLFSENCATAFDRKVFATILDCFTHDADETLILIGHGSPHRHNPVYENLQRLTNDVLIGVIEETDRPNFSDVVERLKSCQAEKVLLAPLLFNGGVHVTEDIAGDDAASWKNRLSALGYQVRVCTDGLGSFEKFRRLYVEKIEEVFTCSVGVAAKNLATRSSAVSAAMKTRLAMFAK